MSRAWIGLGSNLGERAAHLRAALNVLDVRQLSSVWGSDPVDVEDDRPYWNMVAEIGDESDPHQLLERLLQIENSLGRARNRADRRRTIDLDLLLYDDETIESDRLTLPHPRMGERLFVLEPLAEIAPEKVSSEMIAAIAHPARVWRIGMLDRGPTSLL